MRIFRRCFCSALICAFIFLPPPVLAANTQSPQCTNIVTCVRGQFSQKFPFDLLSNLPTDRITCPQVIFRFAELEREFDFCFLYDFMRIIKYPIAAALLIKIYIFS
jgi:hypothetical protein